jgi:hypothetical protein
MKSNLAVKIIGGVAALLLINLLIRCSFDPSWFYGNDVLTVKMEDYSKDPEQFNGVMIGSSCIFWNLDPVLFDSLQPSAWQCRSYNFGSGGTTPPETYYILENLLKTRSHSVRCIILELRDDMNFPPHHVKTLRKRYFMTPRWYGFVFRSAVESPIPPEVRRNTIARYGLSLIERVFNIDYFNDIYSKDKEVAAKNQERTSNIRNRSIQGFLPIRYNREEAVRDAFLHDTSNLAEIAARVQSFNAHPKLASVNMGHIRFINRMISNCNDKGIHIVFLLHPKLDPVYLEGTLALARSIPDHHLIDLSDPDKYPELYHVKNSLNNNHFNGRGTEILSNLAGRKFTELHHDWLRDRADKLED